MDFPLNFPLHFEFRSKTYSSIAFVEQSEEPVLVFFILKGAELINEFGDEITIKTDMENTLPKKHDTDHTLELRQALWIALKQSPRFAELSSSRTY